MQACEVREAGEVFYVIFPSGNRAMEVVHPCEETFDFPASFAAAQLAAILRFAFAPAVGRDHLDAIVVSRLLIDLIGIVSFVADRSRREFREEAFGKNLFHKLALDRRSALDRYGERKTIIRGDSDDLGALAATGARRQSPLFGAPKVASTNASSRFNLPFTCKCAASSFSACSSFPLRTQPWNRR